jgi:hypothetical protein
MAVPSLGEKNVEASHALVACYHVKVSPVQNVAHVKLARRIRRRSVNAKRGTRCVVPVETVEAHLFPFPLPLPLNLQEVVFLRQSLHAATFSVCAIELVRKIKIQLNNIIPFKVYGELGSDPAERTANRAVDPMNLNQVILAEGKNSERNRT